jgi:FKBP-type peptidyl-prolyl cis-trans isomerase SlyD
VVSVRPASDEEKAHGHVHGPHGHHHAGDDEDDGDDSDQFRTVRVQ